MVSSDVKQARQEVYYILRQFFEGTKPIMSIKLFNLRTSNVLVNGKGREYGHNFERDKFNNYYKPMQLLYNGTRLALLQLHPHKMVRIHNVTADKRMVRNELIKALHDYYPEVKILYD